MIPPLIDRFWKGSTIRLEVHFGNLLTGEPMDASGVAFKAEAPDGTTVTPTAFAGNSVGFWFADLVLSQAGIWIITASCTGPIATVEIGQVEVGSGAVRP